MILLGFGTDLCRITRLSKREIEALRRRCSISEAATAHISFV